MRRSTSTSTRHPGVTSDTALETGAAAGVIAAIANVAVSAIARGPFHAS